MMVFLAVVAVTTVVFLMAAAWSALHEERTDGGTTPVQSSAPIRPAAKPETLEGVLVRQLINDEITGPQYRRAMRRLAEQDADRHPVTVPPDS